MRHFQALLRFDTSDPPGIERPAAEYLRDVLALANASVEGNRYIDFGTGIAVCNTGHSHPKIVAAVKEQVERFSHTCVMVTPYDTAVRLAEALNELAPGDTPKKSMFVTTGAEAVENTIKIARAHTGRRDHPPHGVYRRRILACHRGHRDCLRDQAGNVTTLSRHDTIVVDRTSPSCAESPTFFLTKVPRARSRLT